MTPPTLPRDFVWKRLHSLMGLWLVLFLMEHLFVNSQAALLLGENGQGFVRAVNAIHDLPYLPAIEVFLLGVPILIHAVWGIRLLFTSKPNSFRNQGNRPALTEYKRNKAYTWQRLTSWILLIGIIAHVVKFRFLDYPVSVNEGQTTSYIVKVHMDKGLYTLTERLGFKLYDKESVLREKENLKSQQSDQALLDTSTSSSERVSFNADEESALLSAQRYQEKEAYLKALEKISLKDGEVIAVSPSFGTASLLSVRDTFKVPLYAGLYTIFVLAACFHGFNGFWTFLITWGAVIKIASQRRAAALSVALMLIVSFLGLAAIWGTYWLNLRS